MKKYLAKYYGITSIFINPNTMDLLKTYDDYDWQSDYPERETWFNTISELKQDILNYCYYVDGAYDLLKFTSNTTNNDCMISWFSHDKQGIDIANKGDVDKFLSGNSTGLYKVTLNVSIYYIKPVTSLDLVNDLD